MKGYAGKILHVNLTTGVIEIEYPSEKFYRQYVGGSCLGTYYVMNGMKKGVSALSPESIIVFAIGPIAGTRISGAARHSVTAKSPLTGGIVSSEAGGYWAPELKFAGFDAVVITGKAEKPSYLWIYDGLFELRDASGIWGKTTKDAQECIREELNDNRIRVAQIGCAGESLCNYANIVNELAHFNGRGGLGAVMGSKNLRAIAVRGRQTPDFYDEAGLSNFGRNTVKRILESEDLQGFKMNGTIGCVDEHISVSGLPTRNWTSGVFEGQEELTTEAWKDVIKPGTCFACAQSCKRHVDGRKTKEVDPSYGGPEYETVGMCGPNLGIANRLTICKINELTAKYAYDSISFGATVSFLMECYEKGYIDNEYTEGLVLSFGNSEAVLKLAEMTGRGEGFGKKVALGSAELAREIGQNSKELLLTVKNKEMPAHMPQTKTAVGLMYALTPIGADHISGEMDGNISVEPLSYQFAGLGCDRAEDPFETNLEKAKFFWRSHMAYSLLDTASVCILAFGFGMACDLDDLVQSINYSTGWKTNLYEMMMVGERRIQMMRAFNVREGLTKEDDMLPEKLFTPLKGGITDGMAIDREAFQEARNFYYEMAGWEGNSGVPATARLLSLNLDWVVDYLKG